MQNSNIDTKQSDHSIDGGNAYIQKLSERPDNTRDQSISNVNTLSQKSEFEKILPEPKQQVKRMKRENYEPDLKVRLEKEARKLKDKEE
ncbi:hypothetical protein MIDIC_10062 [Alphaproteobacteria bacterium]